MSEKFLSDLIDSLTDITLVVHVPNNLLEIAEGQLSYSDEFIAEVEDNLNGLNRKRNSHILRELYDKLNECSRRLIALVEIENLTLKIELGTKSRKSDIFKINKDLFINSVNLRLKLINKLTRLIESFEKERKNRKMRYQSWESYKGNLPRSVIEWLYNVLLNEYRLIDSNCLFEDFCMAFSITDASSSNPIKWIGTNKQLACLLFTLFNDELRPNEVEARRLFTNKYGKPINANDLYVAKSIYLSQRATKGIKEIEGLIKSIKKH